MALYVVRCNFSDESLEADWNEWYDTEHSPRMLTLPGFRSVTRYRAVGLDVSVKYSAVWEIDGPEALESEEYRARKGGKFPERWRPHIVDWTRSVHEVISHADEGAQ